MRTVLFALLVACSSPPDEGDRRLVARDLANDVVLPTLTDLATRAGELKAAVERFAAAPNQTDLDTAQLAWRMARAPWKEADAFRFGPAKDQGFAAAIDQSIDEARIELEIVGTTPITDTYIAELGANRKGFHAIEYLMFRGDDDASVLFALTGDPDAPRRRELLAAWARDLAKNAQALQTAWADEYAGRIADPSSDDVEYPTIKASIDTYVNELVFQAEVVADTRIGKPMGTTSGGTPHPELQESGPSDNSLVDMTSTLRGVRNMYFGTRDGVPGKGIGVLVAARNAAIDRDVTAALETATATIATIPAPYATALTAMRPEVADSHAAVKELKVLLATEVIGVLGATLKFNDNDGD